MTRQEIAAKLREALALMNDKGAHWIKGDYEEPIDYDDFGDPTEYAYCSVGAIRTVCGSWVEEPNSDSERVEMALARVLPVTSDSGGGMAADRIIPWNDAADRQWAEIVAKFTEAATLVDQTPVIRRAYMGGVEEQTFAEFAYSTIQDDQAAIEVAERMLANPDEVYEWNPDEPEFYETFKVLDADELRAQIDKARS